MAKRILQCVYGKPSIYDAKMNCVSSYPDQPSKWCSCCLVREYKKLRAELGQ